MHIDAAAGSLITLARQSDRTPTDQAEALARDLITRIPGRLDRRLDEGDLDGRCTFACFEKADAINEVVDFIIRQHYSSGLISNRPAMNTLYNLIVHAVETLKNTRDAWQ